MDESKPNFSRRHFLAGTSAVAAGALVPGGSRRQTEAAAPGDKQALIAITLDLEMSMHYPTWDMMEWNYEKGNLTSAVKQYTVEAGRRVKAKGGILQCFLLGRVLEQENVDWLKELVREGHAVGNHTYDHVSVWATSPEQLQYRFQRAPWLIRGKTVPEVIRENILLTEAAMETRIGVKPLGFRTPGGSTEGLKGRPDIQKLLLDLGFTWASSMAPGVPVTPANPTDADFQAVADAQASSQPFVYPTGLIEIPMSPLGDVASFRREKEKWKLGDFLKMVEHNVRWAIDHGGVFDLLTHPSIMVVEDPEFRAYELICDLVGASSGRARIVGLDEIAKRHQVK
ncbi:MAG: polysaccharide deacetylase family protein [Pirellulales bacterium]|nr:polysaccharide deacetylase family protein [Pirellulales bacterium]